ncbi:AbrB/MazE/SpoVT family DNA-binding domain-containing protein [Candidatus Woesearchaeota archaeon]|nr:AbrB/MazE/SpoVT family DNA-binding domain-containing protein [Candidatus Woesearchaeota archaeon]
MKRKVIQIADSTQLISLPREWAKKYSIKKGDELDIEMKGNKLEICCEKDIELEKISIDISGLDRTSIMYYIRSAYRRGYNLIEINFDKDYATHFRIGKEVKVISIIHEEVNRLVGVEIIQQKDKFCVVKDISNASFKDFDTVLRRIFLLLLDAASNLFAAMKSGNKVLVENIEQNHDSITRFISYSLRLINKGGFSEQHKNSLLYTIIVIIDKIVDILKYAGRDFIEYDLKLSNESKEILDNISAAFQIYYELYYKYEAKKVYELYQNRNNTIDKLRKLQSKLPKNELMLLSDLRQCHEYITGIVENRLSLLF